jgi:hypothetical protein
LANKRKRGKSGGYLAGSNQGLSRKYPAKFRQGRAEMAAFEKRSETWLQSQHRKRGEARSAGGHP